MRGPKLDIPYFESDGELHLGGSIQLFRDAAGQYLLHCGVGSAKIKASEPPVIELVDS